jgi:GNAT superfamily N-acetyltransferase
VIARPTTWPRELSGYIARGLQCECDLLARPGTHVVVAREPRMRIWQYAMPLWVMAFAESAVVSVAPEMARGVEELVRGVGVAAIMDDGRIERLRTYAAGWAPTERFGPGLWLYCTRETFTPRCNAEVVPVPPNHPEGQALRERHRGEVFGVFRGGELISRSSIKTESGEAWEIAVTTAEPYRRQGLGASVVSRATDYILSQRKVALYNCDLSNTASLKLAESLGYRLFARDLMWTLEAMWAPWFWGEWA